MGTFGSTSTDTAREGTYNAIVGCKFTCPEDCYADKLSIIVDAKDATKKVKCAIYDSSFNFVAETEERTLALGSKKSEDFDFASPPELTGEAEYWLCVWSAGTAGYVNIYEVAGASNQQGGEVKAYNNFPATFSPIWYDDVKMAILCTYTPRGVQVVSPSAISASSAIQAPSIAGTGAASIAPAAIEAPSAVQPPAITGSGAAPITPSAIAATSAVQPPILSGSGSAPIIASPVEAPSAVQAPALSGSGSAPVTASPVATVSSIQATVLAPTGAAPVSPSSVQVSSAVQAPSMSGTGVATISSSPIAAASAIQTPSIATGVQSIAPLPVSVTSIIVAPIISVAISYRYRYNVFTDNLDIVRAAMSYRYRYNVFTGNQDILGRF